MSCSEVVGHALGPDMMQSAAVLIPDILDHKPLLLYAGEEAPDAAAASPCSLTLTRLPQPPFTL